MRRGASAVFSKHRLGPLERLVELPRGEQEIACRDLEGVILGQQIGSPDVLAKRAAVVTQGDVCLRERAPGRAEPGVNLNSVAVLDGGLAMLSLLDVSVAAFEESLPLFLGVPATARRQNRHAHRTHHQRESGSHK